MNTRKLIFLVTFISTAFCVLAAKSARAQDEAWDSRFGPPGISAAVFALVLDGNDVYAGGNFTTAGGTAANRIARWDGGSWSSLGSGVSGDVFAVAKSGTDLYVGGAFTTAGGKAALRIAKWDGSNWSALGSGLSDDVLAIAVSGSDVYVGGRFTAASGSAALRIAKWDGSNWSALGSGLSDDVLAIAVSGSDVYVGGRFTAASGVAASRIARWNGSTWSAVGTGVSGPVNSIAVSGSDVFVGGDFTTAGGNGALRIARWNGSVWSALAGGVSGTVSAVAVDGSDVYVGGSFTSADGTGALRIAKWDGNYWSALGSGLSDGALAVKASGGDVYAGGLFTTAGGKSSFYFGRWNPAIVAVSITNFAAEPDATGVRLAWDLFADEDVTGVTIYRRQNGRVAFENVTRRTLPPESGIFIDSDVEPGTTYQYVLGVSRPDGDEVRSPMAEVTAAAYPTRLGQNYPNPFNPSTVIRFTLSSPLHVRLSIVNVRGEEIANLLDESRPAGLGEILWDGRDATGNPVSSGVYFSRLKAGKTVLTRKMVLLK